MWSGCMILTEEEVKDKLIKKEIKKEINKQTEKAIKKSFWVWVKGLFVK